MRPILPMPSLIITRNITNKLGPQTYVPERHLAGLIPQALVDEYIFWLGSPPSTDCAGVLYGYQKPDRTSKAASNGRFQLRVFLRSMDSKGSITTSFKNCNRKASCAFGLTG